MFYPVEDFKKLPKLSEIIANDELRPQMSHAYVTKEYIVASDAHILVRLQTKEFFSQDLISEIPKDGWFFDIHLLRTLQKEKIKTVKFLYIEDGRTKSKKPYMWIYFWTGQIIMHPIKTSEDLGNKYPETDDLMADRRSYCIEAKNQVGKIKLKANLLYRLQRGLGDDIGVVLHFENDDTGIYVLPAEAELVADGREAIIMPMMFNV